MYQEKPVDPAWIIDSSCLHNPDQHAWLQFSRDVEVTIWPSADPYHSLQKKKKNIWSVFLTAAECMAMWHYLNILSDTSGIFFCNFFFFKSWAIFLSINHWFCYLLLDPCQNQHIYRAEKSDSCRWTEFGVSGG